MTYKLIKTRITGISHIVNPGYYVTALFFSQNIKPDVKLLFTQKTLA